MIANENRICSRCRHVAPNTDFAIIAVGQYPVKRTCPNCALIAGTMSFPLYGKPDGPFTHSKVLLALNSLGPSTASEVYHYLSATFTHYDHTPLERLVTLMGRMKDSDRIKGDGRTPETFTMKLV